MDTPLFDGELVHARRMIYTPSAFAKSNLVHLQEVAVSYTHLTLPTILLV